MRKKRVTPLLLLFVCTAVISAQQGTLSVSVSAHLLVVDREQSAASLTQWCESIGGYFTLRSSERVAMRIPMESLNDLRAMVYERADLVLEYNPQARDLRQELRQLQAGIASREESLEQILGYLEDADITSTLAFEQELTAILVELESLQGQMRARINDTRFAYVEIALSSREKTIPQQIPSSFGWINRVDLYQFLAEVR